MAGNENGGELLQDAVCRTLAIEMLDRGRIDAAAMREFVETLDLPAAAKQRLLALTPGGYTGRAEQLAKKS